MSKWLKREAIKRYVVQYKKPESVGWTSVESYSNLDNAKTEEQKLLSRYPVDSVRIYDSSLDKEVGTELEIEEF